MDNIKENSGGEAAGHDDLKADQIKPVLEYHQAPFLSAVKRSVSTVTRIAKQVDSTSERLLMPVIEMGERLGTIEMPTPFSGLTHREIIGQFFSNISNPSWHQLLERAFISAFIKQGGSGICG